MTRNAHATGVAGALTAGLLLSTSLSAPADNAGRESEGVIILRAVPGVGDRGGVALADASVSFSWVGSKAIPDNNTAWETGLDFPSPGGIPADAFVTRVSVHHEITHTYVGDLQCKVYNSVHEWMVRDIEGGAPTT